MATFIDVGLLSYFDAVFAILLVFAIVFALLQKTKILGGSLSIDAIVAIAAAFMVLLSRSLIEMINFMIPWFVVAIIFLVLMILLFQMFGLKEASLEAMVKEKIVYWTIIVVGIVIVLAAFGTVFGQSLIPVTQEGQINTTLTESEVSTGSYQQNIYAILFHPKIVGMVVLFAIAAFAIILLSGSAK